MAGVARIYTNPGHESCVVSGTRIGTCLEHEILDRLTLPHVLMSHVIQTNHPQVHFRFDTCGLRLTGEHIVKHATRVAELGLRGTYCLIPPGSYTKMDSWPEMDSGENFYGAWNGGQITRNPMLLSWCESIVASGHELALHNDLITLALTRGRSAVDLLDQELAFFRDAGFFMEGTAAHGGKLGYALTYNNRELFRGGHFTDDDVRSDLTWETPLDPDLDWSTDRTIDFQGNRVQLHQIDPATHGLTYEAYLLPIDARLSDSGAYWGGRIGTVSLDRKALREEYDPVLLQTAIAQADAGSGVTSLQWLMHPVYWNIR